MWWPNTVSVMVSGGLACAIAASGVGRVASPMTRYDVSADTMALETITTTRRFSTPGTYKYHSALFPADVRAIGDTTTDGTGTFPIGSLVPGLWIDRWYNHPEASDSMAEDYLDFGRYFNEGRVTLLTLVDGPSRCPSCEEIYPELLALHNDFTAKGVRVILVAGGSGLGNWTREKSHTWRSVHEAVADAVEEYIRAHHLTIPVAIVGLPEIQPYQPNMMLTQPVSLVIDRTGRLQARIDGWSPSARSALAEALNAALATRGGPPSSTQAEPHHGR